MSNVTCINTYRKRKRRQFIDHNGDRLDHFIKHFIRHHLDIDFHSAAKRYIRECADTNQESWDYLDFREAVREGIAKTIGAQILLELHKKHWFDGSVISADEVYDRCLSLFVLEDWAAIS